MLNPLELVPGPGGPPAPGTNPAGSVKTCGLNSLPETNPRINVLRSFAVEIIPPDAQAKPGLISSLTSSGGAGVPSGIAGGFTSYPWMNPLGSAVVLRKAGVRQLHRCRDEVLEDFAVRLGEDMLSDESGNDVVCIRIAVLAARLEVQRLVRDVTDELLRGAFHLRVGDEFLEELRTLDVVRQTTGVLEHLREGGLPHAGGGADGSVGRVWSSTPTFL